MVEPRPQKPADYYPRQGVVSVAPIHARSAKEFAGKRVANYHREGEQQTVRAETNRPEIELRHDFPVAPENRQQIKRHRP